MFTAQVYNVMVGSLSGIMEEEFAVKDVIRRYNRRQAERHLSSLRDGRGAKEEGDSQPGRMRAVECR